MAFAPLILRGSQQLDGVDVSDQVIAFKIQASRDQIEIPTTFGLKKSFAAGSDTYELEIEYLQDTDTTALTDLFWELLDDDEGTFEFSATLKPGAPSASNPEYTGTAVVTGVALGGTVDTVGIDSVTFPLVDRPVKSLTGGS